jgi:hypothetical protein
MKMNRQIYRVFLLFLVIQVTVTSVGSTRSAVPTESLFLTVQTERSEYYLGQKINLKFNIRNTSKGTLTFDAASVEGGNLRLFVSEDGATFREYVGPDWAVKTQGFDSQVELKDNAEYETSTSLLFNQRVPYEHLNASYVDEIRGTRIDTEYAFQSPGRYLLKAVFDDSKSVVESQPVQVTIFEPSGTDLSAWELLKSNSDSAEFLHQGKPPRDLSKRSRLQGMFELMIDRYPDCIYAERIRELLPRLKGK